MPGQEETYKKYHQGRGKLGFQLEFIAPFHCLIQEGRHITITWCSCYTFRPAYALTWVLTFSGSSVWFSLFRLGFQAFSAFFRCTSSFTHTVMIFLGSLLWPG